MKISVLAGCFAVTLGASPAFAQKSFDGTWKTDQGNAKLPTRIADLSLQNGVWTCGVCTPTITIKADGLDHPVSGQPFVRYRSCAERRRAHLENNPKEGRQGH